MYKAVDLVAVGQANVRKLLEGNNELSQIEEGLFLGTVAAARDKCLLKSSNVTHILSVGDLAPLYPNDFTYKVIEVPDSFNDCFNFIDEAKRSGGGVLVHCLDGISRSETVVLAYLMKKRGMSLYEAMEHVKSRRPQSAPNFDLTSQLQRFKKSSRGGVPLQTPNAVLLSKTQHAVGETGIGICILIVLLESDVKHLGGFSQNPDVKIKWTEHKSHLLLQLVVREKQKKNWKGTYLNNAGKQNVCSEFRRVTNCDLPWQKFKNRLDHLKRKYDIYKKKEFHEEATKLRVKPLRDMDLLDETFGAAYISRLQEWNPTAGSDQIDSHLDDNTDPSEDEGQGDSEEIGVPIQDPPPVPTQDPTTPMPWADRLAFCDHYLRASRKRASFAEYSDQLATSYEEHTRVLEPGRERYKKMKPYSIPVAMDQLHELEAVVHGSRLYWKAVELFETSEGHREVFLSFKTDSLRVEYLERKTGVKRYNDDEGS